MNIIKFLALFFCVIFHSLTFGQTWNHYDWENGRNLHDSVFIKANEFFKKHYKDNLYVGDLNEKDANYYTADLRTDYVLGNIYSNFYGYENYIKEILSQFISDPVTVQNLKVYFYYDSEFNASMDAFGNIRINVGLFHYVNSEAELAGVLAHEYGHFINKDMINQHSTSIQQESTADYQAIKFIKNSPYSTKGLSNAFKVFKRFEIKDELLIGNNKVKNTTHPDPGDRLKQVKILSKDSSNIGKKLFVVDSAKFFNLKKIASQESFNIKVGYRDYHEIIELAFTHYLYYPNDQENLALLIEGIRRYLLINPKKEKEQFIIDFYKGKGSKRSDNYKYVDEGKTSILNYLNKGLLHLPSNDLTKIKAKELLDSTSLKFTSYKEAYTYFTSISKAINCKPCLLTTIFKDEKTAIYSEEAQKENTVFECMNFLNDLKSLPNYSENLYILNFPVINNIEHFDNNSPGPYTEFLKTYLNEVKTFNNLSNVFLINELNFNEQHQINYLNSLAESIVDPNAYIKAIIANVSYRGSYANLGTKLNVAKSTKLNWKIFVPEAYEIFSKYKVKNIYLVNFDLYTFEVPVLATYGISVGKTEVKSKSWQFKKVSINEKSVVNVSYQHNIAITKNPNEECLKDCVIQLKSFLSSNK